MVYPLLQEGLLTGSPDVVREQAALGMGELIEATDDKSLKPFVPQMAGPLIRIIGDRFPWQVKAAILSTLTLLIQKATIMMKPFVPQLQTTFVKNLSDPTPTVRSRAAAALDALLSLDIKPRWDPLVGELHNGIKSNEGGICESMMIATQGVLQRSGATLKPELVESLGATLVEMLNAPNKAVRDATCATFGVYCALITEEELWNLLNSVILLQAPTMEARHGQMGALKGVAGNANDKAAVQDRREDIVQHVGLYLQDDQVEVREKAAEAAAALVINAGPEDGSKRRLLEMMVQCGEEAKADLRVHVLEQLKDCAKQQHSAVVADLDVMVPWLLKCKENKVYATQHAAKRALVHVAAVHKDADVVKSYAGPEAAALKDAVKSLLKQKEDSDEEEIDIERSWQQ